MKVIIAGGRSYDFTENDILFLDTLHSKHKFTKVLSGGCSRMIRTIDPVTGQHRRKRVGADYCGELWARSHGIPVHKYMADWFALGKAAGPIRNQQMVDEADALVTFSGDAGTADVVKKAKKKGIHIWISYGEHYLDVRSGKMIPITR